MANDAKRKGNVKQTAFRFPPHWLLYCDDVRFWLGYDSMQAFFTDAVNAFIKSREVSHNGGQPFAARPRPSDPPAVSKLNEKRERASTKKKKGV